MFDDGKLYQTRKAVVANLKPLLLGKVILMKKYDEVVVEFWLHLSLILKLDNRDLVRVPFQVLSNHIYLLEKIKIQNLKKI